MKVSLRANRAANPGIAWVCTQMTFCRRRNTGRTPQLEEVSARPATSKHRTRRLHTAGFRLDNRANTSREAERVVRLRHTSAGGPEPDRAQAGDA